LQVPVVLQVFDTVSVLRFARFFWVVGTKIANIFNLPNGVEIHGDDFPWDRIRKEITLT